MAGRYAARFFATDDALPDREVNTPGPAPTEESGTRVDDGRGRRRVEVRASPSSGTLRYRVARLTPRTWATSVTGDSKLASAPKT